MDKDTKDKEGKNVKNSGVEIPVIETQQQNGNSDSDDWKTAFEREKLGLEIEKIKADKAKTEIETEELKKPFFKKQVFLQSSLIALLTIIISGLGVGWTIYYGFKQIDLGLKQADKNKLQENYSELEQKNKDAINKNKELESERQIIEAEKVRLSKDMESLASEGNEIKKANVKIDNELKVLTAKSIVQQGLVQSVINDLQLKKEKLEERYKVVEARTIQLEKDLVTADVKGNYVLLRAVTKIPNFIPSQDESIKIYPDTLKSAYEEPRLRYKKEAGYRQGFLNFIETKLQNSNYEEIPIALMFGYVVTSDSKWKNELIEFARKEPFLYIQGNGEYRNEVLFSSLLTALFDKEEDKIQLISLILDTLEPINVEERNHYLLYFSPLLVTMGTDDAIRDKEVFLRLMTIARDDFLQNGPGPGSEVLIRRSLRAYFSVAGKVLADNIDLCNPQYINVRRELNSRGISECNSKVQRTFLISRAGVIGLGGNITGTPVSEEAEIWRRWIEINKTNVDLWLEKDFKTLYQDDVLYKKMTEDKQLPYFKFN